MQQTVVTTTASTGGSGALVVAARARPALPTHTGAGDVRTLAATHSGVRSHPRTHLSCSACCCMCFYPSPPRDVLPRVLQPTPASRHSSTHRREQPRRRQERSPRTPDQRNRLSLSTSICRHIKVLFVRFYIARDGGGRMLSQFSLSRVPTVRETRAKC